MAGKKVLLARPHTFIVAEMQPFLTRAGYAPHKLAALDDLMGLNPASFSGVVISTAVVSAIGATVEEVFVAVRRKMPRVPVIFAGLTEFALAKGAVERAVKALHPVAEVLPVADSTVKQPGLGRENTFVVLTRDDLGNPGTQAVADRILQIHFR
jgi:hypothetical protein